ncbi:hypothetical protein KQX54_008083 [Cotesia glomerata]|uniref:Uncharacterized protein n=1 Tax=Cotesia glomerata TaxID=32391 RepID=A0AAV7IJ97_COTGL|nr:hypothetical protein KQX54_008083 [Cotesia glomerata]
MKYMWARNKQPGGVKRAEGAIGTCGDTLRSTLYSSFRMSMHYTGVRVKRSQSGFTPIYYPPFTYTLTPFSFTSTTTLYYSKSRVNHVNPTELREKKRRRRETRNWT